jgi:hypothetical protein
MYSRHQIRESNNLIVLILVQGKKHHGSLSIGIKLLSWGSVEYTLVITLLTIAHAWKRRGPNQSSSFPEISAHAANILLLLEGWLRFAVLVPCHGFPYFISPCVISPCAVKRLTTPLNCPVFTLEFLSTPSWRLSRTGVFGWVIKRTYS